MKEFSFYLMMNLSYKRHRRFLFKNIIESFLFNSYWGKHWIKIILYVYIFLTKLAISLSYLGILLTVWCDTSYFYLTLLGDWLHRSLSWRTIARLPSDRENTVLALLQGNPLAATNLCLSFAIEVSIAKNLHCFKIDLTIAV